jgi:hypothetical protein
MKRILIREISILHSKIKSLQIRHLSNKSMPLKIHTRIKAGFPKGTTAKE